MIDGNKAEIIGLLCAEGSYYDKLQSYWMYDKNRHKFYWRTNKRTVYVQFSNYNYKLLKWFQYLIKKTYNFSPRLQWDRLRICRRAIIADLLLYYRPGAIKWRVPIEILKNKSLMSRFIRGYFEGDGCASKGVRFSSANFAALQQVQYLLKNLGIKSNIQGPYNRKNSRKKSEYTLRVKSRYNKLFFDRVKPLFKQLKPKLYKNSKKHV